MCESEKPDLSCERSLGHFVTVLGCDADLWIQIGPSEVQVDGGSSTHHLWMEMINKIYYFFLCQGLFSFVINKG